MVDDLQAIFGTSEIPAVADVVALGPMGLAVGETAVRGITWRGIELVRSIDYPIRDAGWGTLPTKTLDARSAGGLDRFRYWRTFRTEDGSVDGRFALEAEAAGRISLRLELTMRHDVRLCRAGFTLLHPIGGLAGEPVSIVAPDGCRTQTRFPIMIAPSQVAKNIAGMRYAVKGSAVEIAMGGEVFEMEDQRNWSDASFKTYGRTASFPSAYQVLAGERVEQELTLRFSGSGAPASAVRDEALRVEAAEGAQRFPELAIAADAGWAFALPPPLDRLRRVVRLDLRRPLELTGLRGPARPAADFELIVSDDRDNLGHELEAFGAALAGIGVSPEHIVALPAAYLMSYQPDGKWPDGATPADAAAAARQVFPSARIGGGVLTNFTELNRCRPDPSAIDYITHSSTAIVHAADDASVFQTLEALPQLFRSAHAIAPGKPYRLGLTAIGARSNPYGAGLADNPNRRRLTLTDDDPRTHSLFGAAWLVGVAAATFEADVELLTLAGAGGPFGLLTPEGLLAPGFHVLRRLATMQGRPRLRPCGADPAIHAVAVSVGSGASVILANGSAKPRQVQMVETGRTAVLDAPAVRAAATDPDWVERALVKRSGAIEVPPYAVAFIELDTCGEN